jgi:hypothetical protein
MDHINYFTELLHNHKKEISNDIFGDNTDICETCYKRKHNNTNVICYFFKSSSKQEDDNIQIPGELLCYEGSRLFVVNNISKKKEDMKEFDDINKLNLFYYNILTGIIRDAFLKSGFECAQKYMKLFEVFYVRFNYGVMYPDIYEILMNEYYDVDLYTKRSLVDFKLLTKEYIDWIRENNPTNLLELFNNIFTEVCTHMSYFQVLLDNGFELTLEYIDYIELDYDGSVSDLIYSTVIRLHLYSLHKVNDPNLYNTKRLDVLDYFIDNGIKLRYFTNKQDILLRFNLREDYIDNLNDEMSLKLISYIKEVN